MPFAEVLSWKVLADAGKLGALSDTANPIEKEIRVSVVAMTAEEKPHPATSDDGDIASVSIGKYMLMSHARSAKELPVGQICELSKYGSVRIVTKMTVGDAANYSQMMAEVVDGG